MIKNVGAKCIIYLIDIYKYLISPLLGNNCRFLPTCSEYTKDSIVEFPTMWEKLVKDRNDPLHDKKMLDESLFENDDIIKVTGECADQLYCSGLLNRPQRTIDKFDDDWETIFTWDQSEFTPSQRTYDSTVSSWSEPEFARFKMQIAKIYFAHVDIAPIEIVTIYDLFWIFSLDRYICLPQNSKM